MRKFGFPAEKAHWNGDFALSSLDEHPSTAGTDLIASTSLAAPSHLGRRFGVVERRGGVLVADLAHLDGAELRDAYRATLLTKLHAQRRAAFEGDVTAERTRHYAAYAAAMRWCGWSVRYRPWRLLRYPDQLKPVPELIVDAMADSLRADELSGLRDCLGSLARDPGPHLAHFGTAAGRGGPVDFDLNLYSVESGRPVLTSVLVSVEMNDGTSDNALFRRPESLFSAALAPGRLVLDPDRFRAVRANLFEILSDEPDNALMGLVTGMFESASGCSGGPIEETPLE